MQERYINLIITVFTTLALVLLSSLVLGAEFTAILVNSGHGDRNEYKLYVKNDKYLLIPINRQLPPILGNQTTRSVRALYPERREYEDLGKEQALFLDPISALVIIPEILNAEKKFVATETVNGHQCDKYVYVLKPGQKIRNWKQTCIELWMSKSLDHFIKGIFHQDIDSKLELVKIKEVSIKDSKFKIPDGYKKVENQ